MEIIKNSIAFQKGDPTLPENYRPISLRPVGYKVLPALNHHRLLEGGADVKIQDSQYGLCPKRNCAHALTLVKRMIDVAHENRTEALTMVFLDWAKAFDRVRGDSMLKALVRFGIPEYYIKLIGSIYEEREFFIQDYCGDSSTCPQHAGIAQGCPLSPFLLIIVQSVMFYDIYNNVQLVPDAPYVVTNDLLYADDTVLLSSS